MSLLDIRINLLYAWQMIIFAIKDSIGYLFSAGLAIYFWESINENIPIFVSVTFIVYLLLNMYTIGKKINLNKVKQDVLEGKDDG